MQSPSWLALTATLTVWESVGDYIRNNNEIKERQTHRGIDPRSCKNGPTHTGSDNKRRKDVRTKTQNPTNGTREMRRGH
ncbi:hypothetical protein BJV77DRAFT_1026628 [Russula vinacea]|nr:hypothetical protein BJV77DRAFT_1026628 [Russula vinacea]